MDLDEFRRRARQGIDPEAKPPGRARLTPVGWDPCPIVPQLCSCPGCEVLGVFQKRDSNEGVWSSCEDHIAEVEDYVDTYNRRAAKDEAEKAKKANTSPGSVLGSPPPAVCQGCKGIGHDHVCYCCTTPDCGNLIMPMGDLCARCEKSKEAGQPMVICPNCTGSGSIKAEGEIVYGSGAKREFSGDMECLTCEGSGWAPKVIYGP